RLGNTPRATLVFLAFEQSHCRLTDTKRPALRSNCCVEISALRLKQTAIVPEHWVIWVKLRCCADVRHCFLRATQSVQGVCRLKMGTGRLRIESQSSLSVRKRKNVLIQAPQGFRAGNQRVSLIGVL